MSSGTSIFSEPSSLSLGSSTRSWRTVFDGAMGESTMSKVVGGVEASEEFVLAMRECSRSEKVGVSGE